MNLLFNGRRLPQRTSECLYEQMKEYYYDIVVLFVFDYFDGELNEEIAYNLLKDFVLRYTEHLEYIQNSEGICFRLDFYPR